MMKATAQVLASLLILCSAIALVTSTPEMGTQELIVVGTVEGKTYFLEKVYKNWTEAKERCESVGMHLATVTSSAQLEHLRTFRNLTGFYDGYWIGARDAQTPAQFVWDHNNGPLNTSLFTNFTYIQPQTCVAYAIHEPTAQGFWSHHCTMERFLMCEIIHDTCS